MNAIEVAQGRIRGELLRIRAADCRNNLTVLIDQLAAEVSRESFLQGAMYFGAKFREAEAAFDAALALAVKSQARPSHVRESRLLAMPSVAAIESSPAVRTTGEITGPGSFEVPSVSNPGFRWVVEFRNSKTHDCRCPAFERDHRCRHATAVMARVGEEWAERRVREDQAEHERTAAS